MAHSDNPNDPDIIIDLWNNMMSGQAAFRREQLECRFGQQSQLPIMKSATRTGTRVPRRSRRIHHRLRVAAVVVGMRVLACRRSSQVRTLHYLV